MQCPQKDQPDTCLELLREGHRTHCYNTDIGSASLPRATWHSSSLVGHEKARQSWAVFGHNVLEVKDGATNSWEVIDPYYYCYFTIGRDSVAGRFSVASKSA